LSLAGLCLLHWTLGFARSPVEYTALLTAVSIFYRADLWLLVMSEEAPPRYRARAMGVMVAFAGLGTLALGELVKRMGSAPDAWRDVAKFPIYGLLLAIPILFLLRETKHFENVRRKERRILDWSLLWAPFDPRYRRPLLVVSFLKMIVAGGVIVVISIVETDFLRVDNGLGQEIVGWLIQWDVFAITAGWLAAGFLSDRIGRRPTSYLLSVVYTLSLVAFALLPKGSMGVMVFSVVHNFASSGIFAVLRIAAMEFFPNDRRATAVAWTDLWAALFAAFCSWFLGIVLGSWHLSLSAVILAAGALVIVVMPLYQLLPETRGQRLEQV
jgi:MFS family permease